ncbi:ABC transporter permease [Microlunatus soli]|uniref:ABC-2 type transport system permease protein n=1 Tax=Microlunatus soli TaxID=630515 RepID=A0A1H1WYA2_9ACTN|nr:ABC-2 family transporter protein [Microlunatus soli]SDT02138.1 ABC-2 type transport system permease protein [Microlunatus soli]
MVRLITIFFRQQLVRLRSAMEYRADFWIAAVGAILQQLVGIVFLVTFFGHVSSLGGWTLWQIAVLHGMVMAADGIREMFADGAWKLRADVNTGSFDRVLVRPLPPALQQATALASIHGIGNAGLGAVVLVLGLARSGPDWHWWSIPVVIMAVLCGTVLNTAISFLTNMIAFWEPSAQSAFPTFVALVRDFAKFPLDIYGAAVRLVVTFLLPYGLISYFPSRLVLGIGPAAGWWALTPLIAAGAAALIAAAVWRRGLNRYQGVGH